ncbi:MAG: TonB-dependent receptor [Gammaproteobacteria bacterium]|nr:TonB-dependent receptor [Gammaproteobacteria bacterium]MBU1414287.1 TonB-dependent receptor [Gammaproteobacteria bacterium]
MLAHAQEGIDPPGAGSYFEDLPIVLTPSRLPQPLREAPAAVTVLDGDLIRATGYRDIARLLRLVPGMQVGQERSGINWVTYHGLGNDSPADMQVLIDGRAVYSPGVLGGVDWLALPVTVDEIDRIEIVRGTDAVAYGPNAFLGVINIITRQAGSAPGASVDMGAGNEDIRDLRAGWDSGPGNHAVRLAASTRSDDGYSGLHDRSRMNVFSLRSDHQISDHDQATLRITASDGNREAGYADSPFNNDGERRIETRNTSLQTQWRHIASTDEEVLVNYFYNNISARDEWIASSLPYFPYVPLNRNRDIERNSVEAQHRLSFSDDVKAVWGGEARRETVEAPFVYYGRDRIATDLYRLFGNMEWRFAPYWTTNLGAMAEKYSDDRARYSPRAFVNWQATPETTLRAGYSRAWRDRNLLERYGDVRVYDPATGSLLARPYVQNPDLAPPRIDSAEIGWLERFKAGDTRLDVRLFNERITGFVARREVPTTPDNPLLAAYITSKQYYNLDSPITLRGLEYQLDTRPWTDGRIILNHVMIDRHIDDPSIRTRVAPYSASVSWIQDWRHGWSSMITALRMGPLAGGEGFFGQYSYEAPAYTTYDFSIQRRMRIGAQEIVFALSGINLGSSHQEIADRSEQSLHPEAPVNPVSRMIHFSVGIDLP